MRTFLLFTFILTGYFVPAQTHSTGTLQRGFYKTYQEYLNNSPSVVADFEVEEYRLSKKDSTIISARYILRDSLGNRKKVKKIWGFSDGENVYVQYGSTLMPKYWRLQCSGPNPYLFYKEKNILVAGPGIMPLITLAATAAVPASHEIMIVTKSGKIKYAGKGNIKKVVADNAAITADIKENNIYNDADKLKYIRWYNGAPNQD